MPARSASQPASAGSVSRGTRSLVGAPSASGPLLDPSRLDDGLRGLGLGNLSEDQRSRLIQYVAALVRWNSVYNLTAIRDPKSMLTYHLLDSLSVVGPLRELFTEQPPTIVDIGSGAGLPGIPLAIAWPEAHVTMVEPVGKKAAFIQQEISTLKLGNAECAHARVEQIAHWAGYARLGWAAKPPALAISRAFASLHDFVLAASAFAGPHTLIAAMKGILPADELSELPPGWQVVQTRPLKVPGLEGQRHLILLARTD